MDHEDGSRAGAQAKPHPVLHQRDPGTRGGILGKVAGGKIGHRKLLSLGAVLPSDIAAMGPGREGAEVPGVELPDRGFHTPGPPWDISAKKKIRGEDEPPRLMLA